MSENKKNKAYVKKLKNGFAIKTICNNNGVENMLIITSDHLTNSNRKLKNDNCTQTSSAVNNNLSEETFYDCKISESLTKNRNAISKVLHHLEPFLCELKSDISGFHIFENGKSLPPHEVNESIIFVANTKLAQNNGVSFNLPGTLVNIQKMLSSENIILNAETVVKPITIIVGNYVVHIKIGCNVPQKHLTKTTGTQTNSVFAEPNSNYLTNKNVQSTLKCITKTVETQFDEYYTMPPAQFMSMSEPNYEMSTSEHQNKDKRESQNELMENNYEPLQYSFAENASRKSSTTQTDNIETNTLGTSTADLTERDSSDISYINYGDSEDNCSSTQYQSTPVKNKSLRDIYLLEDNYNLVTFDSHQRCYDSNNSFHTFVSHHHLQNTIQSLTKKDEDCISQNNNCNSKDNVLTIYNNALHYTSTSDTYDFSDTNWSTRQSDLLNKSSEEKEQKSIFFETALTESSQPKSRNLPYFKPDNNVLRNEETSREIMRTSTCLENISNKISSNREACFKNISHFDSSSIFYDTHTNKRRKYNQYSNRQNPLYCSYNFRCGLKKTEQNNCLTTQEKYDSFMYSKRVKRFDKQFKQKPSVWLNKTKLRITRPKLAHSFSTMLAYFPINNKAPSQEFQRGLKINSVHYTCTRNISNIQTNNYIATNYMHSKMNCKSDTCVCRGVNFPNDEIAILSEYESGKNKVASTCIKTDNKPEKLDDLDDNFLNNYKVSNAKFKNSEASYFDSHHIICNEQNPYEQTEDVNNSNKIYGNIHRSKTVILNDGRLKNYSNDNKSNSSYIIDVYKKEATFGTSSGTVHIFPSSEEVQLANIDLTYDPTFIKEAKSWTVSRKLTDIGKNINTDDSIEIKTHHLNNHYSTSSCPVKVDFFPTNQTITNKVKKEKGKWKISMLMRYLFFNFRKHKKMF